MELNAHQREDIEWYESSRGRWFLLSLIPVFYVSTLCFAVATSGVTWPSVFWRLGGLDASFAGSALWPVVMIAAHWFIFERRSER